MQGTYAIKPKRKWAEYMKSATSRNSPKSQLRNPSNYDKQIKENLAQKNFFAEARRSEGNGDKKYSAPPLLRTSAKKAEKLNRVLAAAQE